MMFEHAREILEKEQRRLGIVNIIRIPSEYQKELSAAIKILQKAGEK